MKKGGIYTGYVESVDFPNKGNVIVKTEEDGQIIKEKAVVKNSIPGQTVKFMVNKKKHGKYNAERLCCNRCNCSACCIHMKSGYQDHISDHIYDTGNQHKKKR